VSPPPLLVIGDALLDRDIVGAVERLSPDAPVPVVDQRSVSSRPGGAGLAALLCAAEGQPVTLLTALADDAGAEELAEAFARGGVELVDLGLAGETPEKVRVGTAGRPLLRLDRGGAHGHVGAITAAARAAIGWAAAVLVSDYGRGVAAESGVRAALGAREELAMPLVWDPHPRGPAPVPGATLVTPNAAEAGALSRDGAGSALPGLIEGATALRREWRARAVAVTRGESGALLVQEQEPPVIVPAGSAAGGDPCGAGDCFAAAAATALANGAEPREAVIHGVGRATAFVAAGGAGRLGRPAEPDDRVAAPAERTAADVIETVRAQGGATVATGGCFDILHAGHVRTLHTARSLGNCLVVCLNSDASARRLKGPRRPIVPQEERAALLLALECVDAVAVFDEDTPERLLERLRPEVWAKGGDYEAADLPERHVVERHGGRCVLLPYLAGHSTTSMLRELSAHAG
jgi:D-beta-D-heptose 7-phosphate kinase/D-beta-D-heptose 1-phosphate adenosyltransferase